jgi:predicted HD phosphohydrolase
MATMKQMLLFVLAFLLFSCGNSPLVRNLENSDKLVVQFNQRGDSLSSRATITTEGYAIQTMLQFADGNETELFKCGYDGNILFYKKGVLAADISFNFLNDGCHHFLHNVNGKLVATKMSNEAVDFLLALAAKSK